MNWMKVTGRIAIVVALGIAGWGSMADPAQGAPKVTIKFAHVNAKTHPCGIGMEYFREKVEKMSNGEILIKVFHSAALGGDPDIIQGGPAEQHLRWELQRPESSRPSCKEFDIMLYPFVF